MKRLPPPPTWRRLPPVWRIILWVIAAFMSAQSGFGLLNTHNTFVVLLGLVLLGLAIFAVVEAARTLIKEILP